MLHQNGVHLGEHTEQITQSFSAGSISIPTAGGIWLDQQPGVGRQSSPATVKHVHSVNKKIVLISFPRMVQTDRRSDSGISKCLPQDLF